MQLPDEALSYQYQSLLCQPASNSEWHPQVEMQAEHFLAPNRLKDLGAQLLQVRSQMAQERERVEVPAHLQPIDAGFIDLPDKLLAEQRKNAAACELARIQRVANRLRNETDRVILLGVGGYSLGARALFQALKSNHHNELTADLRLGTPRMYFDGDHLDNDSLQELLELLQATSVNPELREERWATIVVSKSGQTLETAAAFRSFRKEMTEFYGVRSKWLRELTIPVTAAKDSRLRDLCRADGIADADMFEIPERVGGRFSVFSAAGLLPAAVLGIDIRAMLLGAVSMTKIFLEEPFERNPVLQYAAVGYLMSQEKAKSHRVFAVWSKKLEALGQWYDHLFAESVAKQGKAAAPQTMVLSRDLHTRGQQLQDGRRDTLVTNLLLKTPRTAPLAVSMVERNEDQLNELNRKTFPMLAQAAHHGVSEALHAAARPTADLTLPALSEHSIGQLLQMLMLATVVEGKLMGVNPYGQPGAEAQQRGMWKALRG